MKDTVLTIGACYGGLAVIFGAFGAHILKKKMNTETLKNFETGVKYQMYHALALVFISQFFAFTKTTESLTAFFFIAGTFLFSFSIYGLCLSSIGGKKLKFLGPITPLGGILLFLGWFFLAISRVV